MLRPHDRRVGFGVTLLPNALPEFLSWCRTAEASGFDTIGVGDSQSLYREAFLAAALCGQETTRVKFGPRVINPMTRHPAISASGAATCSASAAATARCTTPASAPRAWRRCGSTPSPSATC